jgi:hypothetical protein
MQEVKDKDRKNNCRAGDLIGQSIRMEKDPVYATNPKSVTFV